MPAEPAPVSPPAHPLPALTTFELAGYRRDLEHALATLPPGAPARRHLQGQLTDVQAEQDSRTRATAARPA
jgi:hypothetical protein